MNFNKYKILNKVDYPEDLKKLTMEELHSLCKEIRDFMVQEISKIGGHLGAGLGVVELTIALHYVFNTPIDKIIWDIGHQAYPHKILTGRKHLLSTIRQENGLSGFCSIKESKYDVFGAGHSSTSISAALGIAAARDLNLDNHHVISIIGDSAMTGGMAYEALNNAGNLNTKMLVILNDNDMSIAPAVGALRNYLIKLINSKQYFGIRGIAKNIANKLPRLASRFMQNTEIIIKDVLIGPNIFESLGFYYIGPIDGHNMEDLINTLLKIKDINIKKPILLHIKTEKGHGYSHAKDAIDKLHGVSKFDIETGTQVKSMGTTYTKIFADTLIHLAKNDEKIVAITAGMPSGTGLDKFANLYPNRFFDVAIAEQHAITFAGGLAISGYKPYCGIYSTFLQRGYDQIIHDIAIQNLPVKFAIDRAGYVGSDGETHCGAFDIAFLSIIPNIVLMAPSSGTELVAMIKLTNDINDKPVAFRYPRGNILESNIDIENIKPAILGKMQDIFINDCNIVIISYGSILQNVILAYEILKNDFNQEVSVIDGRFAKPLDEEKLIELSKKYKIIITIEEGSRGGFGSLVAEFIANLDLLNILNQACKTFQLHMPDEFLLHNTIENQHQKASISTDKIVKFVCDLQ